MKIKKYFYRKVNLIFERKLETVEFSTTQKLEFLTEKFDEYDSNINQYKELFEIIKNKRKGLFG